MVTSELDRILDRIDNKKLPPIHLWDPPLTGEMDMRIGIDGSWFYQGSKIKRKRLVKLFSTILKKESEEYFLITPVEKYKIRVDDAPFVAIEVNQINDDRQMLLFRTNVDDEIIANADHPIRVSINKQTGEPRPYLHIRNGLDALIHRNVFYQLVEWAQPKNHNGKQLLVIESRGQEFALGEL